MYALRSGSEKRVLSFLLGLVVIGIILICSPRVSRAQTADAPVTIEVGTLGVPPLAKGWFEEQIRTFEAQHPEVRVNTFGIVEPQRTRVPLESLPRLAENVIGLFSYRSEVSYAISQDLIVPIDKFLPDPEFSKDDFFSNAFGRVTHEGSVWAVPWCMDSWWLVLDWELFEAEGISEPPKTWEQFIEYAGRLTKDTDGDGEIDQYGIRFSKSNPFTQAFLFLILDARDGASYLRDGQVNFDNPTTRKNLSIVRDLRSAEYTYLEDRATIAGETTDDIRCAMQFMSNVAIINSSYVGLARQVIHDKRLRFAPLPQTSSVITPSVIGFYLGVRKSTPEKERASWEFVKWINRKDAPLPDFWFGYPIRRDFLERDDLRDWDSHFARNYEVAFEQVQYGRPLRQRFTPLAFPLFTRYFKEFFSDDITVDEMIERLNANGDRIIDNRTIATEQDEAVNSL